jgi:D-apiose dehydrogenase
MENAGMETAKKTTLNKISIVGAGNISKLHLNGIQKHTDRYRAVAICDPDTDAAAERAAEYDIAEKYSGVSEMITGADIDAAIVCTPTPVRSDVILPLLDAGIPVLCEKPFAESYAEAAAIAARASDLGVPLCINQNFRRNFSFTLARDALKSGKYGKPLHLTHLVKSLRRDKGWRNTRSRYVMAIMTIHWFDGYRWMLGEEPESIYCAGVNSPLTDGRDDTGISVTLKFPSGAVAALSESFSSFHRLNACSLDCERATFEMNNKLLRILKDHDEVEEQINQYDMPEATFFNLNELVTAHMENRQPETSAQDNLNSMRILEAAYRSLALGRVVELSEIE